MRTTISTKGQLVLPAELRRRDGVVPGQEFEIKRLGPGVYRLARTPTAVNEGFVEHLMACPAHDWFVPVPSDSTADLPGPVIGERRD